MQAIRLTGELEGVIIDPVYEGKSMAGLIDLVAHADIPRDATVLYAHLGGQPALNAYSALFTGDLVAAQEHYNASVAWALRHGLLADAAVGAVGQTLTIVYGGADGSELARATLATASRSANPSAIAFAWYALGEALADTDPPQALACLERARSVDAGAGGDQGLVHGVTMTATAAVLSRHGPPEAATFQTVADAIDFWVENGNTAFLLTSLRNTVPLLVRAGLDDAAIRLGAALAVTDTEHVSYGLEAAGVDDALAEVVTRTGEAVTVALPDVRVDLVAAARSVARTLREAVRT